MCSSGERNEFLKSFATLVTLVAPTTIGGLTIWSLLESRFEKLKLKINTNFEKLENTAAGKFDKSDGKELEDMVDANFVKIMELLKKKE